MKLKLISPAKDTYTVYLDNTIIGTVRRLPATSDSETQWAASAIGFDFKKFGFNTKTEAAEALNYTYQRRNKMTNDIAQPFKQNERLLTPVERDNLDERDQLLTYDGELKEWQMPNFQILLEAQDAKSVKAIKGIIMTGILDDRISDKDKLALLGQFFKE